MVRNSLNLSYRMMLVAGEYYSQIADQIMPFLKGRPASVVKTFSEDQDPTHKIKPLFVRYAKPRPAFIS